MLLEMASTLIIGIGTTGLRIIEEAQQYHYEFTGKNKPGSKTKFTEIETLKITVRNITDKDIKDRKLEKSLKGVVITSISSRSAIAGMLREGDIIIEVQKNKVLNSKQLNQLIENIYKKGEQTLLLTIINNNNQRRYLGVKTN